MANYEKNLDAIFHALADPTRRAIIGQLVQGTASVKQLAEPHDMALPSFMKHISVLESSELITTKKKGRVRSCEIRLDTCATAEVWLTDVRKFWEDRLEALTDFLDSEQTQKKE